MLKKLRIKFVLITMAMVTLVVVFAFSVIAGISYQRSLDTVYSAMYSSIDQAVSNAHANNSHQFSNPGFSEFFEEFNEAFSNSANPVPSGSNPSSTNKPSNSGNPSNSSNPSNSGNPSNTSKPPSSNSLNTNSAGTDTERNTANGNSSDAGTSSNSTNDNNSSDNYQNTPHSEIGNGSNTSLPVAVYKKSSDSSSASLVLVSSVSTAIVSTSTIDDVYQQLSGSGDSQGVLPQADLFYVKERVSGITYYAFASTSSAQDLTGLYVSLISIAVATLFVFFIISLIFSKWALRPVEEAWTKQHQFLADASHELKTPLTVILANSDIMLSHPESSIENQRQWVESTQHEALGMQDLVVSMLDLAKMEAENEDTQGHAKANFEDVDMSDLVFRSTLQFESRAFEENVNLADDIDEGLHVMGETTAIERLCGTLLDNACKYSPEGSNIVVSLKRKESSAFKNQANTVQQGDLPRGMGIVLAVTNEGPTIDPEDLSHLFDRFYRSDKARTHEGVSNSYGLGLAIAANTVTAHKGCIMATSIENTTTFTVVLPCVK